MPRVPSALTTLLATVLGSAEATAQQGSIADPSPTVAPALSPAIAVERLFVERPIPAAWFTGDFVAAVPPDQVGAIVAGLVADFGALVEVDLEKGVGTVALERASVPVTVHLDAGGRIAGLLFGPPVPTAADPTAIADQIAEAAVGSAAVLALVDGVSIVARHADRPMAVGSAFKLFVLAAYEAAIADGRLARDQVVTLLETDRSLPSGVLQTLAPGTPVTLEVLAGLMIHQSDNTATDALMRVVGRDAVDAAMPRGAPTLTTAELFKLKTQGDGARRQAFAAGDEAARRTIIDALAKLPLPAPHQIETAATWREAEWFATPQELCTVLLAHRAAPALGGAPNPLVAQHDWPWTGFKGGSEFGVLAL
ncbi:MAG: serine hydrolase, partial [Pseudomonadota bacterium]